MNISEAFYAISILGLILAYTNYLRKIIPKSIAIKDGTMTDDIGFMHGGTVYFPITIAMFALVPAVKGQFTFGDILCEFLYVFNAVMFVYWNSKVSNLEESCFSFRRDEKVLKQCIKFINVTMITISFVSLYSFFYFARYFTDLSRLEIYGIFGTDNFFVISLFISTIVIMTYINMYAKVIKTQIQSAVARIIIIENKNKRALYGKVLYHDNEYVYFYNRNPKQRESGRVNCYNKNIVSNITYINSVNK